MIVDNTAQVRSEDSACCLLHSGLLLGLLVDPDYGDNISSEMSLNFYQNTQRYIPDDITTRKSKALPLASTCSMQIAFYFQGLYTLERSYSELM
jgi:hypothetical protein